MEETNRIIALTTGGVEDRLYIDRVRDTRGMACQEQQDSRA
jgi:hypothetical protein